MKSYIWIIIAVAIVLIMSVLLFSLNVFTRPEAPELYEPAASLSPGNYSSAQSVNLSCLPSDADIYYTINGDTPDITKTFFTGTPIPVSTDTTTILKAICAKAGKTSTVKSFIYTVTHQLLPPTASPKPKEYEYAQDVNLSCEEGSTIYYTLDNSIIDNHSKVYSSPIRIFTPTTVRAICSKNGYMDSNIFTGSYFVRMHPDPYPTLPKST
ncbi:MAG: chitobiase/beta-hexosaminidase C-terminal domain-containing protein [Candidatus Methanoperedens sp.]